MGVLDKIYLHLKNIIFSTCLSKTPTLKTGTWFATQKHQHQRCPFLRTHRQRFRERQSRQSNTYLTELREVEAWRSRKGALHSQPRDFDPSRYASFSVKEVVEEPVAHEHIHDYVERSRLSRRLGFWSSDRPIISTSFYLLPNLHSVAALFTVSSLDFIELQ